MLRLALYLFLAFLLFPECGFTQVRAQLSEGEDIRIIINNPETRRSLRMSHRPTVVRFLALANDSLYAEYRDETITIPLVQIGRTEQNTGKTKGHALTGAIVGGVAGLLIAGLYNSKSSTRSQESTWGNFEIVSREESMMLSMGLGVGLGALTGTLIRSPKWEVIDLTLFTSTSNSFIETKESN